MPGSPAIVRLRSPQDAEQPKPGEGSVQPEAVSDCGRLPATSDPQLGQDP
jgi:hypothetical protein